MVIFIFNFLKKFNLLIIKGAQPKAGDICKCVSVTAEVNEKALDKRIN